MIALRAVVAAAAALLAIATALPAAAAGLGFAIVTQEQASLRAAPRSPARQHALLSQGETLEVRGERLDYLQVYDHRRERGGFVRTSQVRRLALQPEEAPELLAIVRFLRGTSGNDAMGIGFVAAYIEAAPAAALNGESGIEALDALGTFAERLARRASSAHLDVAARYGVRFASNERDGRVHVCYDGDAFRRVLAMRSTPEQRARAALALTRRECLADASPPERRRVDEWRAEVLDRVDADALPGYLRNRVLMRRAGIWSGLAYQRARQGDAADAAANRALADLVRVDKMELADEDARTYRDTAMRVSASRWASAPAPVLTATRRPYLITLPARPGETCILLADEKSSAARPLARRCTSGIVWIASATLNREGTALALAVQPTDAWRELWVFHKSGGKWTIRVLPPAATTPDVGYAEFAGWAPGGRQMLVAREASGEGKYRRSFEVVRLDTLATVRQASDPSLLGAFQRWRDPLWQQQTLSVR